MITFYLKNQELRVDQPTIASGTLNYLTADVVTLTPDWDGLNIFAHFIHGDEAYSCAVIDGKIPVEAHMSLSEGQWDVYFHGNRYGDSAVTERITTTMSSLFVDTCGQPFPSENPSAVEIFANKAIAAATESEACAARAEDAAERAEEVVTDLSKYVKNTNDAVISTEAEEHAANGGAISIDVKNDKWDGNANITVNNWDNGEDVPNVSVIAKAADFDGNFGSISVDDHSVKSVVYSTDDVSDYYYKSSSVELTKHGASIRSTRDYKDSDDNSLKTEASVQIGHDNDNATFVIGEADNIILKARYTDEEEGFAGLVLDNINESVSICGGAIEADKNGVYVNADPINQNSVANKKYVDGVADTKQDNISDLDKYVKNKDAASVNVGNDSVTIFADANTAGGLRANIEVYSRVDGEAQIDGVILSAEAENDGEFYSVCVSDDGNISNAISPGDAESTIYQLPGSVSYKVKDLNEGIETSVYQTGDVIHINGGEGASIIIGNYADVEEDRPNAVGIDAEYISLDHTDEDGNLFRGVTVSNENVFIADGTLKVEKGGRASTTKVPVDKYDVANKKYVDDAANTKQDKIEDLDKYIKSTDKSKIIISDEYLSISRTDDADDSASTVLVDNTIDLMSGDGTNDSMLSVAPGTISVHEGVGEEIGLAIDIGDTYNERTGVVDKYSVKALAKNYDILLKEDSEAPYFGIRINEDHTMDIGDNAISIANGRGSVKTPASGSHIANKQYVDSNFAKKNNAEFTGSISMNRSEGTEIGSNSVSTGNGCSAVSANTFSTGYGCYSGGQNSFSAGSNAKANGADDGGSSFALGYSVLAKGRQFVCGLFNKEVANTIMRFIVGVGSSPSNRKNGFAVDVNGSGYFAGDVYANSSCDKIGNGNKVATIGDLPFVVTSTMFDIDDDPAEHLSASWSQISSALASNKPVFGLINYSVDDEEGNHKVYAETGMFYKANENDFEEIICKLASGRSFVVPEAG